LQMISAYISGPMEPNFVHELCSTKSQQSL
jgi:hypothetical protein